MRVFHKLIHWYRLNHGIGEKMRDKGAVLMPCPHCEAKTYVYRSQYDETGMPISFSICLWCEGVIEYGGLDIFPTEPYRSHERRAEYSRS